MEQVEVTIPGTALNLEYAHLLLVVQGRATFRQKEDVPYFVPAAQNCLVRLKQPHKHANNKLVLESCLAVLKEWPELFNEFDEDCVDQLGLHSWCQTLVEFKLFDD